MSRTVENALLAALERERVEEPARLSRMLEDNLRAEEELLADLERDRLEEPERLRAMLEADRLAEARLLADVLEEVEDRTRCASGNGVDVHTDTLGEVNHDEAKDDGEG